MAAVRVNCGICRRWIKKQKTWIFYGRYYACNACVLRHGITALGRRFKAIGTPVRFNPELPPYK